MSGVPSNIIVPFVGVEFDNSMAASPSALNIKVLLVGQKTSSGVGVTGTTVKVGSTDEVQNLTGAGSQLHMLAKSFFMNNQTQDCYIHILADEAGGSAMTGAITITASSALAGELDVYIDGVRIAVSVTADMSATQIGDALVTALTAKALELPITTFLNTAGVVSFAAKNKGTVANDLDVRFNYYDGEIFPSGVSASYAVTTPGTVDPELNTMIASLGEEWFHIIASPYTDATNLGYLEDELASRFGPMRQIDGMYISAKKDTDANLISFGTNSDRNSPHVTIFGAYKYPSSICSIVGALAGQVAASIANDAAVPLHRMTLAGILPPRKEERATLVSRNSLALAGIATLNPDNGVQTEACVTMYLKNAAGASDTSYQQMNSLFTLMVLRYRFRNRILGKYPRAKLADSVIRLKAGQQVITPEIGKAEALAWFLECEADGLVENMTQFKDHIVCVRDSVNRNRLNWLLPPELMSQFIVGSGVLQFR